MKSPLIGIIGQSLHIHGKSGPGAGEQRFAVEPGSIEAGTIYWGTIFRHPLQI